MASARAAGHALRIQGSNSMPAAHPPMVEAGHHVQTIITQRFNKLVWIDTSLHTVSVQAGITFDGLQQQLAYRGYWLPIDACSINGRPPIHRTIGGLIATNSAGPLRSLRRGWPQLIMRATCIDAQGDLFVSDADQLHVDGHAATHSLVGSCGTLGLIAEVTLRVIPPPADERALLVFCESFERARSVISALERAPQRPAYLILTTQAVLANNTLGLPEAPFTVIAGSLGFAGHVSSHVEKLRTLARVGAGVGVGESITQSGALAGRLRLVLATETPGPLSLRIGQPTADLLTTLETIYQRDPAAWLVLDLLANHLRGTSVLSAGALRGISGPQGRLVTLQQPAVEAV